MAPMPDAQRLLLTLVLVQDGPRLLLGMKKKGFGEGRWNGFGGKVEPGESIEEAAHRELREECGIGVMRLEKAGEMEFAFVGNPVVREMHVFRASGIIGEPAESEEMMPRWFDVSALPYDAMWVSDVPWYPYFLEGKPFKGRVLFENEGRMLECDVREV